jgi:polysaccharide pyruvyl transferase WcaK-like protein
VNHGHCGNQSRINDATDISTVGVSRLAQRSNRGVNELSPRIALLTPYTGANLGDASIQDAMITNLSRRLPGARFSGISLNCDNFMDRHGECAFPLLAHIRVHGIYRGRFAEQTTGRASLARTPNQKSRGRCVSEIRSALKSVPVLWQYLKLVKECLKLVIRIPLEIRHSIQGYRFLRTQDLLVVSGGGQLNEEWGGAWQHPFGLFKWAVLARIARVPYVIASVGTGQVTSTVSRMFVSGALRLARYRSYRDKNTREIATRLMRRAAEDPVVPDLAFSLSCSELPPPASIRAIAQGRTVIAVSPFAYCKPGMGPFQGCAVYDRYVEELTQVLSQLLGRGYFLVIVWSCLEDDETVIPELLGRLDDDSRQRLARQMHIPTIVTWRDLVATLQDVDLLIASRLHSTILGFVSRIPTVAISFDPKVDWLMEDLGQTEYLLKIRDFTSTDVIQALDRLEAHRDVVLQQVASYRHRLLPGSALQYDILAELAVANRRMP